jgi:hypothetical protein
MNDRRIAELVAELESAVPKEGAAVLLQQYGGGPDESRIVANQNGYLRFGIELLKCGLTTQTTSGAARRAALDLRYLMSEQSDVGFDEFELSESLTLQSSPPRRAGIILKAVGVLVALGVLAVLAFAFVGVVSVFK